MQDIQVIDGLIYVLLASTKQLAEGKKRFLKPLLLAALKSSLER